MLQKIQFNQNTNRANTREQAIPIKNKVNFMAIEETIIGLKPDAFEKGLATDIVKKVIQKTGLEVMWVKIWQAPREVMQAHYKEHKDRPFFNPLIDYTTRGKWEAILLRGEDAVAKGRKAAKEIRNELAPDSKSENLIHSSDSVASGQREKQIHVFNNLKV